MRVKLLSVLCAVFLLAGCRNENTLLQRAMILRNNLSENNKCSFLSKVTADYGEKIYQFSMECQADKDGNVTFTVTEPATIAGITGRIDAFGGTITFDDKVLAFQTIADGQVTPVTAPWLLIKTLKSGYLRDCTDTENGYKLSIDDSYEAEALRLQIYIEKDLPVSGEIFWKGRRVLTLTVENFKYL